MHAGPAVLPGVKSHSLEHGSLQHAGRSRSEISDREGRGVLRLQDVIMNTVVDSTRP